MKTYINSGRNTMLAMLVLTSAITFADSESCTPWEPQTDGTSWRECVDDKGNTYCQRLNQDGSIDRVKCSDNESASPSPH